MTEPLVVTMAREFKANLLLREQQQMHAMTRAWLQVEHALEAQVSALSFQLAGDEAPSVSQVLQLQRTRSLLAQAQGEVSRYTASAARTIADGQQALARLGLEHAVALTQASYPRFTLARFAILPVDALESMAGFAGDGTPLSKLLARAWPDAAQGITDALTQAVALGRNPNETARLLNDGLALGLNRTLVITRTEQLRAYRDASRQQYAHSGVVTGYKRIAAHDHRICLGCLLADGRTYATSQALDEHPQGRCSTVPIVSGAPVPRWQAGGSWLREQDPDVQKSIMGPQAYSAWRGGQVALGDLVRTTRNATWGGSVMQTPLKDLVSA